MKTATAPNGATYTQGQIEASLANHTQYMEVNYNMLQHLWAQAKGDSSRYIQEAACDVHGGLQTYEGWRESFRELQSQLA